MQERADASFKRKQTQASEATKAMADYEASQTATRAKTERLKALRLAKEAADRVTTEAEAAEGVKGKKKKV
jgi:hypothetical protein